MREIALDTETTGFEPSQGHRVIEIGCVEMIGRIRTGKTFHVHLNPERTVPPEATRVHGLTDAFLADKPKFASVAEDFLRFIGDDILVIHNAEFDLKFLNHELGQLGRPPLSSSRVVDTLMMARRAFPGAPASLDALCRRFNVDLGARTYHGALLDSELLADVYLELLGGRQTALSLDARTQVEVIETVTVVRETIASRGFMPSAEELAEHEALLGKLKNPLWKALEAN